SSGVTATATAPVVQATAAASTPPTVANVSATTLTAKRSKPATAKPAAGSGVLGASHTAAASPTRSTGSSGGNLPFTGLPIWIALLAAGGLILVGGLLRLGARPLR